MFPRRLLTQNFRTPFFSGALTNFRCFGDAAAKLSESVIITNSCAKRIKQLQEKAANESLHLRVSVEGGGCSGFQYIFEMESEPMTEDDLCFEKSGAKVVVDDGSLELIKGATVDYVQEMIRSSFAIVNNPQSESACGCGSSFAVKNFSSNPAMD